MARFVIRGHLPFAGIHREFLLHPELDAFDGLGNIFKPHHIFFVARGNQGRFFERMQKQIKDIETSIDKDALTMSEADRKNKERDASNLKIDFQRKQRELREDVNLRKNEELGALQDRINKAVTAVSEAEAYDLVVYGGVAYANKKIDITDKVLKSLGKK